MSDLFSSSKGPGLIGLILGLIVLGGFGFLGMAVFDGRLNGDFSGRRAKEHERNQEQITRITRSLADHVKRQGELKRYREVHRELTAAKTRRDGLQNEIASAQAEIAMLETEWDAYREEYRRYARTRILGTVFETVSTSDGRTFTSAKVSRVTPLEMTFLHRDGVTTVKLALLPDAIRDRLQIVESEEQQLTADLEEAKRRQILQGRIKSLSIKIQQIRDYNARVKRDILKNNKTKALNEVQIAKEEATAIAETERYELDKQEGRSSRADERATAAERRALGLKARNLDLLKKNAELEKDIAKHEGQISANEQEIEKLKETLRRRIAKKREGE